MTRLSAVSGPGMSRPVWLVFAVLGLVWGSGWIAADALVPQVPPLLAASARFLLSALLLSPFLCFRRHRVASLRALAVPLLLSVTMIVLPLLLLTWVRPQLPSATVVVLFAATPLVVVLLTPLFAGQDVPPRAMQAAVAGLGGLVLATGASFSAAQTGAAAVVFVAVLLIALSSLIAARLARRLSAPVMAAVMLGAAGLLLAISSRLLERGAPVLWNRPALVSLLLLAAVGGAPAYTAWLWLLRRLPAYQVVTVQWVEPLVALAESAAILRMGLSASMLAGTAITVVSLVVLFVARNEDSKSVSLLHNQQG